ncbi:enoyl-CoA hydratase/isomerase family protein [Pseudomonas monteilii]|nr:enoyl-CoA hydratase/isomerase family protein [Pseudomonas monteilii]
MMRDTVSGQGEGASLVIEGRVATITLNRPETFNALDISMARCLARQAREVESCTDVHVLVLQGAGKVFCAGGDIGLFIANAANLAPAISELLTHLNDFLLTLRRMPQLVIMRIHGIAAGAGMSLAGMGDICICTKTSRFRPAYATLGVSPDAGASVGIVQSLGAPQALQLFLLQDEITGPEALQCGLATQVVDDDQLDAVIHAHVQRLSQFSSEAIAATKRLFWQSAQTPMGQQLGDELRAILNCMATAQFHDNIERFAARRKS